MIVVVIVDLFDLRDSARPPSQLTTSPSPTVPASALHFPTQHAKCSHIRMHVNVSPLVTLERPAKSTKHLSRRRDVVFVGKYGIFRGSTVGARVPISTELWTLAANLYLR